MKQAGLVTSPRRGWYQITPLGKDVLKAAPDRIDNDFLMRFDGFRDFRARSRSEESPAAADQDDSVEAPPVAPVQAFYQAVAGLVVEHAESNHVALGSLSFQLVILKIPERIASSIEIKSPPRRRSETPIKLVLFVASIAVTRSVAAMHGGELNPPEREWEFQGCRVCDGQDPKGNVVQFRQNAR